MIQPQLTIAYYQQDIVWERPTSNYALVESVFATLGQKADVLVVPETFNTGFSDNMAAMAEVQEGPTLEFARQMAREHDALFVGTWTVQVDGGLGQSAQLVVDEERHLVAVADVGLQRRLNLNHQERPVLVGCSVRFRPVRAFLVVAPVDLPLGSLFEFRLDDGGAVVAVVAAASPDEEAC